MRTLGRLLASKRVLIGVIAASFLFRCFLLAQVAMHPDRAMQGDAGHYDVLSRELLDHHHFWGPSVFLGSSDPAAPFRGLVFSPPPGSTDGDLMPESFRTPAYPAFLAAVYGVVGHRIAAIAFVQLVMIGLIAWMMFRICSLYFPSPVGLLAVALFVWNCEFLELPNLLLTETLFTLLLVLALWCLLLFSQRGTRSHLVAAGVAVGVAALCRPAATYYGLALVPIVLWACRREWRRAAVAVLVLLASVAITLAPWLARNQAVFGVARLSAVEGLNLYLYNIAFVDAKRHGTEWPVERRRLSQELQVAIDNERLNPLQAAEISRARAMGRIREDSAGYIKVHARGSLMMLATNSFRGVYRLASGGDYQSGSPMAALTSTGSIGAAVTALLGSLSPVTLILLAILGARLILMLAAAGGSLVLLRHSIPLMLGCVLTAGYFLVVTGPLGIDPRFRAPMIPALTLLSTIGIARLFGAAFGLTSVTRR